MAPPLIHLGVEIGHPQHLPPREGIAEQVPGIHVLPLRRAAGAIVDLTRRIAVEEEKATGPDHAPDTFEQPRAIIGTDELDEDP